MVANVNEALFAELLLEADKLVREMQQMQDDWPKIIEKGTKDGINSAMLGAKMAFGQLMDDEANKLKHRALESASLIQKAHKEVFSSFLGIQKTLNSRGKGFILLCAGVSFVAALVGCFVGIKLSNML